METIRIRNQVWGAKRRTTCDTNDCSKGAKVSASRHSVENVGVKKKKFGNETSGKIKKAREVQLLN